MRKSLWRGKTIATPGEKARLSLRGESLLWITCRFRRWFCLPAAWI